MERKMPRGQVLGAGTKKDPLFQVLGSHRRLLSKGRGESRGREASWRNFKDLGPDRVSPRAWRTPSPTPGLGSPTSPSRPSGRVAGQS